MKKDAEANLYHLELQILYKIIGAYIIYVESIFLFPFYFLSVCLFFLLLFLSWNSFKIKVLCQL